MDKKRSKWVISGQKCPIIGKIEQNIRIYICQDTFITGQNVVIRNALKKTETVSTWFMKILKKGRKVLCIEMVEENPLEWSKVILLTRKCPEKEDKVLKCKKKY